MNNRSALLFNNLRIKEQRDFFILYVGLHFFNKKKRIIKHTRGSLLKLDENNPLCEIGYSFRLEVLEDVIKFVGYKAKDKTVSIVEEIDGDIKTTTVQLIDIDFNVTDSLVELLLDSVQNNVSIKSKPKEIILLRDLKPEDYFYRFVLGSGVTNQKDYNGLSWLQLKNEFETAINVKYGDEQLASKISSNVFNTNYGSFQLIKDIQYDDYESIISNMIENLKEPDIDDDTMLSAVVDVLDYQSTFNYKQTVVTFNYDDLLEKLWEMKNGYPYFSGHKSNGFLDLNKPSYLSVFHPHGFASKKSRDRNGKILLDGIVLTTEEYIDAYASPQSTGYRILFEQLEETCCFIGNSITDYEEQKVLKKHLDKYPSSFHFAYLWCKDFGAYEVLYKTIFLLKIGIIPLWYKNHNEYKNLLKQYAGTYQYLANKY